MRRHGDMWGAALPECLPECDAMCVCDGGEQCEHLSWSIDDEDDRYCVDCFAVLYDDDLEEA